MKYKVGDKVRIKSKEWFEEMAKFCGKEAIITYCCNEDRTYKIDIDNYHWYNDDMFDDSYSPEKSILTEGMIKDITEVIKKHNLGVCVSENDGKLIIEPLKGEDDLPIDTPCMCSDDTKDWSLRYYYMNGKFFSYGLKSNNCKNEVEDWLFAIEYNKFDPNNIQESLKYNIVK